MQQLPKILLVEDDRNIASAVVQALRSSYDVELATTGQAALYKTLYQDFELLVLDLRLPDMSGTAVCQQLRDRGLRAPILIVSGENKTLAKISALDAGANDYLTKPFSVGELKARMRVLIRDSRLVASAGHTLQASGIRLNRQTCEVYREDQLIALRRKEFALLECLMEHAGSVVTRETLLRTVWHSKSDLWTNTVDVHIKYLRDKIDRPFELQLIKTVHGRGYKLEIPPIEPSGN